MSFISQCLQSTTHSRRLSDRNSSQLCLELFRVVHNYHRTVNLWRKSFLAGQEESSTEKRRRSSLIGGRSIHTVDDDNLYRATSRLEFQS
jgi:hypothetical protein